MSWFQGGDESDVYMGYALLFGPWLCALCCCISACNYRSKWMDTKSRLNLYEVNAIASVGRNGPQLVPLREAN